MNTLYRIIRALMPLNALLAAFLTGGLVVGGDYIGALLMLAACPLSIYMWWMLEEIERENGCTN